MRRITLMRLRPTLLRTLFLVAVFVLGAAFNSYVMPWLARDVDVYEISGVKGAGCTGFWGATFIRLGQPRGAADGKYEVRCGEFLLPSDTVQLHCECR